MKSERQKLKDSKYRNESSERDGSERTTIRMRNKTKLGLTVAQSVMRRIKNVGMDDELSMTNATY